MDFSKLQFEAVLEDTGDGPMVRLGRATYKMCPGHPNPESKSVGRDTQFAGFAEKLERDIHFLAFGMYHNHKTGEEVKQATRKMIARRAYDLVRHTVGYSLEYVSECGHPMSGAMGTRLLPSIPDLTKWPEETSE